MNTIALNQTFIIAAYSVTWLVLIGYAARLLRKGARVRSEYDRVARENTGAVKQ